MRELYRCSMMPGMPAEPVEAGFAMDDVALFLDTHPENQDALRYYKAVRDMRDQSMAAYERRFGPLRYTDVTSMSWNWVTEKWPWEGGWRSSL